MTLPRPPYNPQSPIPNNNFYSAETSYFYGPYYPATIDSSSGLVVNPDGSITVTGGGGGGGVTSVTAGAGLLGGTITTTGTISLPTTGVAAGSYTRANITVDAFGRITAAANGTAGTVTSVATGTGLTGGPITTSGTISLANTAVAAGSYTYGSFTVDAQGRLTAANNGVNPVTAVSVTSPIVNTGAATTPNIGIQTATTGQLGAVQVGTNINVAAGVISVNSSSTTQSGIVQLNNTLTSTSATEALTAAQGKILQDQINGLSASSNLIFAGTFDAAAGQVLTVTTEGTAQGFVVGSNLPAPAAGNADYFVIVTTAGSYSPPGGGGPFAAIQGDWLLSDGSAWEFLNVGTDLPIASTGTAGIVELADTAETQTGTDTTRAVTPAGAAATYVPLADFTVKGDLLAATAANTPVALPVGADGEALVACAAAATGLCWTTLPDDGIPCACITGVGALVTGTAAATPVALPVGANGQILVPNSACTAGLEWVANPAILCSALTAKGSIISASAAGTPEELAVGADGQVLVACSTAASGLCWSPAASGGIPCACITAKGTLVTGTAANTPVSLPVGPNNTVLVACSSCTSGLTWINALDQQATTTVSGCVYACTDAVGTTALGYGAWATDGGSRNTAIGLFSLCAVSGNDNVGLGWRSGLTTTTGSYNVAIGSCVSVTSPTGNCQLAIGFASGSCWLTGDSTKAIKPGAGIIDCAGSCGTAGQVLMSDGANAICWGSAGGSGIPCAILTAKGTLVGASAANTPATIPAGTDGQVLVVDSTCTAGVKWSTSSAAPSATPAVEGIVFGCTTDANCNMSLGNGLAALTTGCCNTFIGKEAGVAVTTGCSNTAIGAGAGDSIDSGCFNTAIGKNALTTLSSGRYNVAVGDGALQFGNNNDNTAIGSNAAGFNTGTGVVAIGANAGNVPTNSTETVYIGYNAGLALTQQTCSVIIGSWAGSGFGSASSPVGCSNVLIGQRAGNDISGNASFNVVVGDCGGHDMTTACANVGLGACTLCALTTGDCNLAIGTLSGSNITTGCYNVAIGYDVQVANGAAPAQLAIGYGAGCNWLTGTSTKAIRPGAGIIDCAGSCGTSCQILTSTGSNAIRWEPLNFPLATPSCFGGVRGCTGVSNTSLGSGSGALTTGTNNLSMGVVPLLQADTGSCNVAFGNCSLCDLTSGNGNIGIGDLSGDNITTGSNNVAIGTGVTVPTPAGSNQLAIGYGPTSYWLTGCSNGDIQPGAGVIDGGGNLGSPGQVLSSTGTGIQWTTVSTGLSASKGIVPDLGTVVSGSLLVRYNDATAKWQWRWTSTGAIIVGTATSFHSTTVTSGAISQTVVSATWYDFGSFLSTTIGSVMVAYLGVPSTGMYRVTAILGASDGSNSNITIEKLTGT